MRMDKMQTSSPARKSFYRWAASPAGMAVCAALTVVLLSVIPRFFNATFFYWDDTMQSFVPLWHHLGERLRSGHFDLMDSTGWVGGNYAAEVGYGIWNPLNLLDFIIVSLFNNLSWAAFFVITQFMAMLAFRDIHPYSRIRSQQVAFVYCSSGDAV